MPPETQVAGVVAVATTTNVLVLSMMRVEDTFVVALVIAVVV
jgi:hypothetical protein